MDLEEFVQRGTAAQEAVDQLTRVQQCGHDVSEIVGEPGSQYCSGCQREHRERMDKVLWCDLYEAQPNPMFTEDQRRLVRFLRYDKLVACAECGRRGKSHWTMLCTFEAKSMGFLVPSSSGKVHMPLTGVCQSHLLAPVAYTPPPPKKKKKASAEAQEKP